MVASKNPCFFYLFPWLRVAFLSRFPLKVLEGCYSSSHSIRIPGSSREKEKKVKRQKGVYPTDLPPQKSLPLNFHLKSSAQV